MLVAGAVFPSIELLAQETTLEKKFRVAMNNDQSKKALQMIPKILSGGMQHLDEYPEEYASLMNLIGVAYAEINENEKATTYYELALNRIGIAKSDTCFEYGLYAYNLGMAYCEMGQYETADPYISYALPIVAKGYGVSSYEYTMMYFHFSIMYVNMGRYPVAEAMFNGLLYYFEQTQGKQSDDYMNALGNMGRVYEGMGRYQEAEQVMNDVLGYYKGIGRSKASEISAGLNNLAHLYWKLGRHSTAEETYKESLAVLLQANLSKPLDSARLMNNLALVYKTASRFPEAEASYRKAIDIYERLGLKEHPDYTNPLNNLGELYRIMGRTEEAIALFSTVIELREKLYGTEHPKYANAVNNLGLVYFGLGYYPEAEQMLLVSKHIYKEKLGVGHDSYGNVLNNLGILYKAANMLDESEKNYVECLEITEQALGTDHPKYAMYLNGAGILYAQKGEYSKAVLMLEQALSITRKAYGEENYDFIDMTYNLAEVFRDMDNRDKAQQLYLEAMDGYVLLIHKYFPYLNEEDKTAFYHTVNYRFDTYNSFVIDDVLKNKGKRRAALIDKMFNLQLEIKSMLLNEVASIREKAMASPNKELLKKFQEWQLTKQSLISAYTMSEEQRVLNSIDIIALEHAAAELESQLNQGLYESELGTPRKALSWKDLAKNLKEGEALVEMIRVDYYNKVWTDSVYYVALIIDRNSSIPDIVVIRNGAAMETEYYNHYRRSIWNQKTDDASYARFWQPIKNKLKEVSKVYFTPDGCYHKLNLYTLNNMATGNYLIDELSIVLQTNSIDFTKKSLRERGSTPTIEIFAYPNYYLGQVDEKQGGVGSTRSLERYGYSHLPDLPGTKTEAENISRAFAVNSWKVGMNLWAEATEEKLKRVANPDVLHIATHGYFLDGPVDYDEILAKRALNWADKNPLFRSGVMLAGAGVASSDPEEIQSEDGVFSAYEAMQMDLTTTELVVLSACETGLGELLNGQGVYGLQRAFMAAGTEALIMSLWQVEDNATQELMVLFYEKWLSYDGTSKQEAFRASQQEVKKKYPNPVFWGAFVMLGQ